MRDRQVIQSYINNFRRHITSFLRPRVGIRAVVHPCVEDGAVIEFFLGPNIESDDEYSADRMNLAEVLAGIRQNFVGGNLGGVRFLGTNISLEPDRIMLIKEDSLDEWSDEKAKKDIESIVSTYRNRPK